MTRREHILAIVAEEGVEVAQRATKALRFGLDEIQPEQLRTNLWRLLQEYADLGGAIEMLLEQFLEYSKELGTLKEDA
jgi:hypothetical protein